VTLEQRPARDLLCVPVWPDRNTEALTPEQIAQCRRAWSLVIDGGLTFPSTSPCLSRLHAHGLQRGRPDRVPGRERLPARDGGHGNARLSLLACLAHEYAHAERHRCGPSARRRLRPKRLGYTRAIFQNALHSGGTTGLHASCMRRRRHANALVALVIAAAIGCPCTALAQARGDDGLWRELQPGLGYRRVDRDGSSYHAVMVDLATHELRVADASRSGRTRATVGELAQEAQALVAVNGSFFDDRGRPLGLVVSEQRELNPLRAVSWWAALVVRDTAIGPAAEILTTAEIQALPPAERGRVRFALQVGPRTVSAGRALKLKPQLAERSAACVLDRRHVVLLATEHLPVDSNDLAAVMSAPAGERGFGCSAGLMFDGGPSTQLQISTPSFTLSVPGGWGVPNALVVVKRRQ
jgi:phosphodiester glycosidase